VDNGFTLSYQYEHTSCILQASVEYQGEISNMSRTGDTHKDSNKGISDRWG